MISPVCLSVSVFPIITFKPIDRLNEIQKGGHAIKGDLDDAVFNPLVLTILKLRTFELLRWIPKLAPVRLGLSRVKFRNHGKQTVVCDSVILMQQCLP
jgi:hypothetical protein